MNFENNNPSTTYASRAQCESTHNCHRAWPLAIACTEQVTEYTKRPLSAGFFTSAIGVKPVI
eukprot:6213737-Pleurochrysis_carterae.AAC.2